MEDKRRRSARIEVKIPAKYKIILEGKEQDLLEGEALIKNLSQDGLCLSVELSHAKTMGDLLKNKHQLVVEFELPSSAKLVKPLSKIIWTENLSEEGENKHSMGIYFVEFNEQERKELIDFLNLEYLKHRRIS